VLLIYSESADYERFCAEFEEKIARAKARLEHFEKEIDNLKKKKEELEKEIAELVDKKAATIRGGE